MASLVTILPEGITNPVAGRMNTLPEAATQSFRTGAPVDLASGKVTLIVAAGNSLGANDDLYGIAMQDATGTTDSPIDVYQLSAGDVLLLPVYHATPASAVTAQSQVGVAYELYYTSDGILAVDIGSTSNTKGKIIKIAEDYPVGEQYGLVYFQLDPAQLMVPGT